MRFNWRFWQSDKDRLTERAVEEDENRLTPLERDLDQEDFEGKKEDLLLQQQDFASSEALGAFEDELKD
jgi:hypothetical protein